MRKFILNTFTSRALAVFLSIALLLSLFSACTSDTKSPQDDEPATTVSTEENIPDSSDNYITTSWEENGSIYIGKIDAETGNLIDSLSYEPVEHVDDMYETLEEIQAKYPDKKALVWSSADFIISPSELIPVDEINDYLDSLGKDYVICYSPISLYTMNEPTWENQSYEVVNNDTVAILDEKLSSGEQIDIITTGLFSSLNEEEKTTADAYEYFILNGILEPLDSYFDENETAKEYYDSLPEAFWDSFRRNGSIYQIGSGYCLVTDSGISRIRDNKDEYLINERLMNEYGWDIEKPIEEQLDIINNIIKNEDGFSGISNMTSASKYYFDGIIGVAYDGEEDKAIKLTESDEYRDYVEWLYVLNDAGVFDIKEKNGVQSKIFIYLQLLDLFASEEYDSTISGNSSKDSTEKYLSVISDEGYCIKESTSGAGVCTSSDYKQEAFDFIILALTDPTLNNLISFGVEDVDDNAQDGAILSNYNEMSRAKAQFLNPLVCSPFTNGSNITAPENVNEMYREIIFSAEESSLTGLMFDFSDIGDVYADVIASRSDFNILDYDSADEAIAELDRLLTEAGIDELIEEVNSQYQSLKAQMN